MQIMSQIIQRVGLAAVITKGSLDFLRQQALLAILNLLSFLNALNKDLTACLQPRV